MMPPAPKRRPRKTEVDPALKAAITAGLKAYREEEGVKDAQVARRLGVSSSALCKYMKGSELIGGAALARALDLGVRVIYRGKELSARDPKVQDQTQPVAEQISFVFEQPCLFEETPAGKSVTIERKPAGRPGATVHLRVAG